MPLDTLNLLQVDADRYPVTVTPRDGEAVALDAVPEAWPELDQILGRHGAVLLRDFDSSPAAFRKLVRHYGEPLSYRFGSTPRSRLGEGVYTSTEYPAHQSIPLHNEQAYTREWPLRIYFHCEPAAEQGGETPIADSRMIFSRMPPRVRERFERHGLLYVRNYGNGFDVPWQTVFDTDDRGEVERYCAARAIECDWKADGELRTRQRCQVTAQHPQTGEWVWFNQAHLFHISNLELSLRETLLDVLGEDELPRNVYFGDGSPIDDGLLDEVRAVLADWKQVFPWKTGDVMLLDNMLAAHAREPFSGRRKVAVAMTHPFSAVRAGGA